jgi:RNA polymerase sigma factor (sigma-70 family)
MRNEMSECSAMAGLIESAIEIHGDKWYRFVLKVLGNAADAEDVLQEGIRRVLGSKKPFSTTDEVRLYLSRVISNTAFELYRSKKKLRSMQLSYFEGQAAASGGEDPRSILEEHEQRHEREMLLRLLEDALRLLPVKEYEALLVTDLDPVGCSIREASMQSGIPYSTLRHRRNEGLRHLRRYLCRVLRRKSPAVILV